MFDEGIDDKYAGRIQAQSDKGFGNSAYIAGRDPNEYSIESSDEDEECSSTSLIEELEKKYLCNVDIDESIIMLKSMTSTNPCKLASEHTLVLLVLNHKYIDRIGDKLQFLSICGYVREVDLAWNRLSSWEEITAIFSLPRLEVLNLGYNPLQSSLAVLSLPLAVNLELFILNGTDLQMSTVQKLLNKMPKLKELHLSENRNLENRFDVSDEVMSKSLESLHVSKCNIEHWETVTSLWRFFPNLTSLSLCENPIRGTSCKLKVDDLNCLNGVRRLSLNKCLIDNWSSIEHLANINTLQDLRIIAIPLWEEYTNDEHFHLVIGRIPQLKILNGSVISAELREQSERYYDVHETKPKIFARLIERHGHVEQLCKVDMTPKKYAVVAVICEETGYNANLKIRLTQTVSCLMHMLEKLTGIPVRRMRLFYINSGNPFPDELRFPSQMLQALHIEDGGKICVQV
ncbi:leucine Rich Repeat family protein [Wuchereria bancrofti]|uniref:Leucine Rich Repeat family protein n=1 Tax=Wuchereria bancrofti TaxID=6293 RepID=J9FFX2_WUCBA|nr:leucine Rich Repeat family protein [Wuchereria bancrofti]